MLLLVLFLLKENHKNNVSLPDQPPPIAEKVVALRLLSRQKIIFLKWEIKYLPLSNLMLGCGKQHNCHAAQVASANHFASSNYQRSSEVITLSFEVEQ
jgi:hypothetical protein